MLYIKSPFSHPAQEQYIFCYRAIKEYVDSLSAYSNFQGEEML